MAMLTKTALTGYRHSTWQERHRVRPGSTERNDHECTDRSAAIATTVAWYRTQTRTLR
jgi:hypothetical protein